ncbi:MAG: purine-nucleoside phosphorylase [Clostridiaceae bacterium]|nr:purine-nucleoside phosphorylase [Clostridiaceae bacterium]
MQNGMKQWQAAADTIRSRIGGKPKIAIILGSGLGSLVDVLEEPIEIEYGDIPGFPETTVKGHSGRLVYGKLGGKQVLVMKGRFHFYEGYDISQVVFHIRVFKLLGISDLLVTNAAGGINTEFKPGDLMMINDHISFFAPSPLRGVNMEEFGPRFPDMSNAYDSGLIAIAEEAAKKLDISLKGGIYAFLQGPMFETPAEIRALRMLGADAVGMSTVPEVIMAHHSGMNVMGISCITNMAAGVNENKLNHEEVIETGNRVGKSFAALVTEIVSRWPL